MSLAPENKISMPVLVFASLAILLASISISGLASAEWPLPISGLILPLFMLLIPWIGIPVFVILLMVLWFWWFRPFIRGSMVLKMSSLYMLGVLFLVSAGWYYLNWEAANTWRRPSHAIGCASINLALIVLITVTGLKAIKQQSQMLSMVVRAVAIVWAVTYGYAYFGELP